MKQLAVQWADNMRTGHIPRDDAWLAFNSTIWKSLTYPLPALNLSKEDCEKIMAPILHYLLPAIGVCRNFPRNLVYNSERYLGLGVKHLHTTQEIARIKDILNHVYIKSNTGYLYKTSLELLILELGIDTDISLINPETLHLLATESLIKSTCQFLLHHQLKLKHDINRDPLRVGIKRL